MNEHRQNIDLQNRLSCRDAVSSDEAFFEKLFIYTRQPEFARLDWDEQQLNFFLKMQFDTQQKGYQMQFPHSVSTVIELDKKPIGRLILNREKAAIRLIDIAVLPEFRGLGAGSFILRNLQTEANRSGKDILLQVLKTNFPAVRLYKRFDFGIIAENELYLTMKWSGEPL